MQRVSLSMRCRVRLQCEVNQEPEELLPKPKSSEQRNYVVTACTVDTQLPTHVRTYVHITLAVLQVLPT